MTQRAEPLIVAFKNLLLSSGIALGSDCQITDKSLNLDSNLIPDTWPKSCKGLICSKIPKKILLNCVESVGDGTRQWCCWPLKATAEPTSAPPATERSGCCRSNEWSIFEQAHVICTMTQHEICWAWIARARVSRDSRETWWSDDLPQLWLTCSSSCCVQIMLD